MPFNIIRNDITKVTADAIVNTANPEPTYAGGTDAAIYAAAGAERLLAERKKIGRIAPGDAAVTPAFGLPAKYIIHTVGPAWIDGRHGEYDTLRSCYKKSLALADSLGCESVAFPLISTGVYGFPKDRALDIALKAIKEHLEHSELDVTLVVFEKESYRLAAGLIRRVEAYINENYVSEQSRREYGYDESIPARNENIFRGGEPSAAPRKGGLLERVRRFKARRALAKMPPPALAPRCEPYDLSIANTKADSHVKIIEVSNTDSLGPRTLKCHITPGEPLTIGRDPGCDVVLEDGNVSRLHARLYCDEAGRMVIENCGRGGLQVNGVTVAGRTRFSPDDFIRLGSSRLTFRLLGAFDEFDDEHALYAPSRPEPRYRGIHSKDPVSDATTFLHKESLEALLNNMSESFQRRLFRMIDERGLTDPDVYKRANIDRKLFSKIRVSEEYIPKKKTVEALAIALRLDIDDARDLLASAGYALANNNKSDVIIRFCLKNRFYDIFEVNALLFEFDQPTLS